ncbi:MAG: nucleotidyl transferase AbiEii/AbiGii toxin family protein, partial [Vicinamibacteria bacterium]
PFLGAYRLAPLVAPHYGAESAASQKVKALLGRRHTEARDIFDLHILCSRLSTPSPAHLFTGAELTLARDRVFSVDYDRYRDTVVAFLAPEDQSTYDSTEMWEEIRLRVEGLLESGGAE